MSKNFVLEKAYCLDILAADDMDKDAWLIAGR